MTDTWPALYLAGLGTFHGLNPAMGWLFAVALGLHRQSRTAVMASLVPIVIGHAVSIAVVAGVLVLAGALVPHDLVRLGAGAFLLAWAAYHWRFGHRHRVRFGMLTGFGGLAVWSFLMATAHGAGLMLWPALMPACLVAGDAAGATAGATLAGPTLAGPVAATLAGIGIHTLAMAATAALVAVAVYDWLGVAVLRRTWLNADLLWMWALVGTGALLIAGAG